MGLGGFVETLNVRVYIQTVTRFYAQNTIYRVATNMGFRIIGLPAEHFSHFFDSSDEELTKQGAVRKIADAPTPGYPCRFGLTNSSPGDELLLVN
jgi:hypothetical protein